MSVAIAAVAGIGLCFIAGPVVLVIGLTSLLAMLGYVGGPFPYGYRGLGEVSVFVFFGVVATVGSRYVHDMAAPLDAWLLAVPVGLLASALLVVNNLRDIDTDRDSGKRTLAVIIGQESTRWLYAGLVYGAYVSIAAFAAGGLDSYRHTARPGPVPGCHRSRPIGPIQQRRPHIGAGPGPQWPVAAVDRAGCWRSGRPSDRNSIRLV